MSRAPISFDDGAAYDRMMGGWSRLAGDVFLDWLALPAGLRWLDVGCGNGAFTGRIVARAAPSGVDAIDPSAGQIEWARAQAATAEVRFRTGDAASLPYADASFDVALMALVIFFVPDPAACVAEMVRVVRPGGAVAAYVWDMHGGGFPHAALASVLHEMGTPAQKPPSVEASRIDTMRVLWQDAGLAGIETRQIAVERRFANFDEVWASGMSGAAFRSILDARPADEVEQIRSRVRARLAIAADGSVTQRARANAVKGRRPG